jgi:membrane protein DedA with SNARE-associated domain
MKEWIVEIISSLGYAGIGFLMFLENIFPPIPSEVIMPMAGIGVLEGRLALLPTVAVGVAGTMVGTLPWYCLGRWLGHDVLEGWLSRYGKWLCVSPRDLQRARSWFERHGRATVFFGRLIPGVRTFISVPAGACGMPLGAFLLYSCLGTTLWVGALTLAGYALGGHLEGLEASIGVFSKVVLGSLLVAGGLFWARRRRLRRLAQQRGMVNADR